MLSFCFSFFRSLCFLCIRFPPSSRFFQREYSFLYPLGTSFLRPPKSSCTTINQSIKQSFMSQMPVYLECKYATQTSVSQVGLISQLDIPHGYSFPGQTSQMSIGIPNGENIPDEGCTIMQSSHHGGVAQVRSLRTTKSCQVSNPQKGPVGSAPGSSCTGSSNTHPTHDRGCFGAAGWLVQPS